MSTKKPITYQVGEFTFVSKADAIKYLNKRRKETYGSWYGQPKRNK
jgi:hypothetical protein